jgi:hypothetical protein
MDLKHHFVNFIISTVEEKLHKQQITRNVLNEKILMYATREFDYPERDMSFLLTSESSTNLKLTEGGSGRALISRLSCILGLAWISRGAFNRRKSSFAEVALPSIATSNQQE